MMAQAYSLTPLDTLFFRDGRPFGIAESTDVRSMFPPTPHTFQGLVRSRILETGCGRWPDYARGCMTAAAEPCDKHDGGCVAQTIAGIPGMSAGTLRVRGPWIRVGTVDLLPAPLDLVASADDLSSESGAPFDTAILGPMAESTCNLPGGLRPLGPPGEWSSRKFEGVAGWIAWPAFRVYLSGVAPRLQRGASWWRQSDLLLHERRPGVAIEPGRNRAREHYLYFAEHLRMRDGVAMAIEVEGADGVSLVTDVPVVPLGGERRVVTMLPVESPPWKDCPTEISNALVGGGRIKVVLTQPAWFRAGWHPTAWSPDAGTAQLADMPCSWIAARVERPDRVGGWDFVRNDQKPSRLFVPRGSVFYLEAPASARESVSRQWAASLSETPDGEPVPYSSIGWGHALLGVW